MALYESMFLELVILNYYFMKANTIKERKNYNKKNTSEKKRKS